MDDVCLSSKSPVRKSLPIEHTNTGTIATSSSTAAHRASSKTCPSHFSKTSLLHSLPVLIVLYKRCNCNAAKNVPSLIRSNPKIWANIRPRSSNSTRDTGKLSKLPLHLACTWANPRIVGMLLKCRPLARTCTGRGKCVSARLIRGCRCRSVARFIGEVSQKCAGQQRAEIANPGGY